MDANKRQRYEKISIELTKLVGGKENIQGVAHCATRLRIVLKDNDQADLKAIEDVDLAKGVFVAGDQVQIIFGAGLVNDVYEVFAEHNNMKNMSLSDLKTVANKKMNPLQRIIKVLSDVFVDIMPGILAAALLTGLSGVLGNLEFVKANDTLFGINRLINISSGAIFGFLPLAVAYSACKRFGGRPILGIVIGCGFLMTMILGRFMDKTPEAVNGPKQVETAAQDVIMEETAEEMPEAPEKEAFFGYALGEQIAMEDVKDETFANKVLGDGVAVLPEEGKVYAPADGTITSIFDTKHAVCFTSRYGAEILIHIGVDTVNLQGKYFTAHVEDGASVKKGQLLIEFDKEQIGRAGYDTVIPMIFTDLPEEKRLEAAAPGRMSPAGEVAAVYRS